MILLRGNELMSMYRPCYLDARLPHRADTGIYILMT
jgi:hypothetical protein